MASRAQNQRRARIFAAFGQRGEDLPKHAGDISRRVTIWAIAGLAANLLVGCSHSHKSLAAGTRVYVDLHHLEALRMEWNGVRQVGAQARALAETPASPFPPALSRSALPTLLNVRIPSPPSPPAHPVDRVAMAQAVAASTPSPAVVRQELLNETNAEQQRFASDQADRMRLELETRHMQLMQALFAEQNSIRKRFEHQIISDRLHRDVLAQWLLSVKAVTVTAVNTTAPQKSTPEVARVQAEIVRTEGELNRLESEESAELAAVESQMAARLREFRSSLQQVVNATIERHNAQRLAAIDAQVRESILDVAREAQQRASFYASAAFRNPLSVPLGVAAPAAPDVPSPLPLQNPGPEFSDALASQRRALQAERMALADAIDADTRSWVEAIAARKRWDVSFTPDSHLADATPQIAVWIRDRTIPPEVTH